MAQFAELLLPLAIKGTYTYRIPEDMRTLLQIGCRVCLSGKRRFTRLSWCFCTTTSLRGTE